MIDKEFLYIKTAAGELLLKTPMGYDNVKEYCKLLTLTRNECQICVKDLMTKEYIKICQCYRSRDLEIRYVESKSKINKYLYGGNDIMTESKKDFSYTIFKVSNKQLQVTVDGDTSSSFINRIINDYEIRPIKIQYQSKENEYIIFDYTPVVNFGFNIKYLFEFESEEVRDFYDWKFKQLLGNASKLEKLYLEGVK